MSESSRKREDHVYGLENGSGFSVVFYLVVFVIVVVLEKKGGIDSS